jgi:hypothetical protein
MWNFSLVLNFTLECTSSLILYISDIKCCKKMYHHWLGNQIFCEYT